MGLIDFGQSVACKGNYYFIRGFPVAAFVRAVAKYYKSSKLINLFEITSAKWHWWEDINRRGRTAARGTIKIHKFFIPELLYLMEQFRFPLKLRDLVYRETWVGTAANYKPVGDVSQVAKQLNVSLREYQQEFIDQYEQLRGQMRLFGYILSFEQGLGKTVTSLALMTALRKKLVVIIAPKSTLETVWEKEIQQWFRTKQDIRVVNRDSLDSSADFWLVNYESMDKLDPLVLDLRKRKEEVGFIVDESHNFLRTASNRTGQLVKLRVDSGTNDMLLMSGTPVKALGVEVIPMLKTLDPFFDDDAEAVFRKALGVNTTIATDVLESRLGKMMYRRTKAEVLPGLPEKREHLLKVTIPNGADYTVPAIQRGVQDFIEERYRFHKKLMPEYAAAFREVMTYLQTKTPLRKDPGFRAYLEDVEWMKHNVVHQFDGYSMELVKRANAYEKAKIVPILPPELKKKFFFSKSAVKYLNLKIQGEVIGSFLGGKRIEMTTQLMRYAGITDIIDRATKKTVLFTSYVDTIETAGKFLIEDGYTPLLVYGKTASDVSGMVKRFIADPEANPMVASILMVATGVTLIVANTMIFLNKPWRHSDYEQCAARVHRIGQDSDVDIYTILLDTGNLDNLSTRMEEVMAWSKDMFDAIVGDAKRSTR